MRSIETHPSLAALREVLRRGDPAGDGREPGPEEVRLLRARMLEEARRAPTRARRRAFRPAVAFAWAALVCVALAMTAATVTLRRGGPPAGAAEAAADPEAAPRQVQFTTPGGTRIVWVLYPETP